MDDTELSGAGEADYDGIRYEDLDFATISWHDPGHIQHRSARKGADEMDLEPSWVSEAVADTRRIVGSGGSRSRLTVAVLGHSASAGRVLHVVLLPVDRPPEGRWYGVTAWPASRKERKRYEER